MKIRKTELGLKTIVKKIEEYIVVNGKNPKSLEDIAEKEEFVDSFGNPFIYNEKENLVFSFGLDGRSEEREYYTKYDDIRSGFVKSSLVKLNKKNMVKIEKFRENLLNFLCYEGKFPQDYLVLKESGYLEDYSDVFGNEWIVDSERKLAASAGFDGVYTRSEAPDGDDILISSDIISQQIKIDVCKNIINNLAEKFTAFEINNDRTLENLLPLMHSDYIPQMFRMTDPWGNRFHYHRELKFVYSYGPDGKHSVNETSDWNDDLTKECGINSAYGVILQKKIILKKQVEKIKIELNRLGLNLKKRDIAIGKKSLTTKTLGRPLREMFEKEYDEYGEKYYINFKEKIIYSSGRDKIKENEDDISLCWKNLEIPEEEKKVKKTEKKFKKKRRKRKN